MTTEEVVRRVIGVLNDEGVPYMIVGSLATNFYCVPRSTQDADIVVQSRLSSVARRLVQRLSNLHFDPQIRFESVTATKKALLSTDESDFEFELFELSGDEHDQQRFSRRVQVEMLDTHAWIATIDDMIVTKLRWSIHTGREKDVADLRNLISIQAEFVDWPYVESWCDRHGTRELLDRLRRECIQE